MTRLVPVEALAGELRALMRHSAVDLRKSHLGPLVRSLCEIAETDSMAAAAATVSEWLSLIIEASDLPPNLRICAVGAFGLHEDEEARHALLRERCAWIGRQVERSPQSVRNYLDRVAERLAVTAVRVGSRVDRLLVHHRAQVDVTARRDAGHGDDRRWQGTVLAVARHTEQRDQLFLVLDISHAEAVAIPSSHIGRITRRDESSQ